MEELDLLKRAEDLSRRCIQKWEQTHTGFLTPAEQLLLENRFRPERGCRMQFTGGYEDAERCVVIFLPEEEPDGDTQIIHAVHYRAYFGVPGHRDYLGALLASGIARDRLGDILIEGEDAWVFCMAGIVGHLLNIDRIGRVTVRAEEVSPDNVPIPKQERRSVSFTVMSPRIDAVAAGMFRLSRSRCADLIREGMLSLNYHICDRTNTEVKEGDILSLRGFGKGRVAELGGSSRKGRQFVQAELYK